ncbi:MAG: hypothetical protein ACOCXS_03410 [Bacteroidota bacterium]
MNFDQFLSDSIKYDSPNIKPSRGLEQRLMYVMGLKSSVYTVQRNSLVPAWITGIFTTSALAGKLAAVSIILMFALTYRQMPSGSNNAIPPDSTEHHQLADSLWHPINVQWEDSVIR